jgi:methionine-gamma-lyase
MPEYNPDYGLGSLVNHMTEGENPYHAHITPLYQTSTFAFPDVATGAAIWRGEAPGYFYTRIEHPNLDQLAKKIAVLESYDLLHGRPGVNPDEVAGGLVTASGMAAITTAILACVKSGDTIIAQASLYGATYTFLQSIAPNYGIQTVFLTDTSAPAWEAAFAANPGARLAYVESPANPMMTVVDIRAVAEVAHKTNAWVMVDNTFATPYCQRPLSLGADVVLHSTTKYLSGHGLIVGGAVVSTRLDYIHTTLPRLLQILGGTASPFDSWLANIGLKTFEIRMQRHCENARAVARALAKHPRVARVYYPGLPDDPGYEIARRQMLDFGPMMSFELKDGFAAGEAMMNRVRLATLAVSLGNTDTLIQHPASMTHSRIEPEVRRKMGITDGLVRLSVGIENGVDIIADLEQALQY